MYKIEHLSNDNRYHFFLMGKRGHIILRSEGFTSLDAVKKGIEITQQSAVHFSRYERKTTSDGKFYFNLRSSQGEVLGKSQLYSSEAGMENGILAVRTNADSKKIQLPA